MGGKLDMPNGWMNYAINDDVFIQAKKILKGGEKNITLINNFPCI